MPLAGVLTESDSRRERARALVHTEPHQQVASFRLCDPSVGARACLPNGRSLARSLRLSVSVREWYVKTGRLQQSTASSKQPAQRTLGRTHNLYQYKII